MLDQSAESDTHLEKASNLKASINMITNMGLCLPHTVRISYMYFLVDIYIT